MELKTVKVKKPSDVVNVIIGYSHFIKTVEDIYEAMVNTVPDVKFGVAFCEASDKRLIRVDGTDDELKEYAAKNALEIGAGHSFIILIKDAYPINFLTRLKNVPEIVRIMVASSNPLEVIVAETEQGRGIIGIIDGEKPLGIESENDVVERKKFLRNIGYKR